MFSESLKQPILKRERKRERDRKWRRTHLEIERARGRRHRRVWREWIENLYKIWGCVNCGQRDSDVLEFHHLNSEKPTIAIGHLYRAKEERKLEEIQKGVIVCANCHRKVHAVDRFTRSSDK